MGQTGLQKKVLLRAGVFRISAGADRSGIMELREQAVRVGNPTKQADGGLRGKKKKGSPLWTSRSKLTNRDRQRLFCVTTEWNEHLRLSYSLIKTCVLRVSQSWYLQLGCHSETACIQGQITKLHNTGFRDAKLRSPSNGGKFIYLKATSWTATWSQHLAQPHHLASLNNSEPLLRISTEKIFLLEDNSNILLHKLWD